MTVENISCDLKPYVMMVRVSINVGKLDQNKVDFSSLVLQVAWQRKPIPTK